MLNMSPILKTVLTVTILQYAHNDEQVITGRLPVYIQ